MRIPPGHTEKSVLADIKHVTTALSKHMRFGYHEIEDLKQEGFIFALEALEKFDESKSALRTFLYTVIRRLYINMKRNQYFRQSTPCSQCVFFQGGEEKICGEFDLKPDCPKYAGWEKRNASKQNLMGSADATNPLFQSSVSSNLGDDIDKKEMLNKIDLALDPVFRSDYCKLRDGVHVPKKSRLLVEAAILEILGGKKNE